MFKARCARPLALLPALVLVLGSAVAAEPSGGGLNDWEVSPFAGFGMPDEYPYPGLTALEPDPDLLYGVRLGYFLTPAWSAELSWQMLSTTTDIAGPDPDLEIQSVRWNVLRNWREGARVRPFATGGIGLEASEVEGLLDEDDFGVNLGGGVRWFLTDGFGLRFDGRVVFVPVGGLVDHTEQNLEATIGATWTFGGAPPPDTDGDGVADRKDACPDTPAGALVDDRGCPADADGDKVFDGLDDCPDTPSGWPVDEMGCPVDADGDGVPDGADACPGTPRGAPVDARGCPADADGDGVVDGPDRCPATPAGARVDPQGCPTDADKDGVFDGLDRCSDTPPRARVDEQGCPTDADKDGVWDGLDQCPDTPGGTRVDAKGCPVQAIFEGEKKTLVLEGVHFEVDSAVLRPDSLTILNRVAASLKDWPDVRVEVGGHTDSSGGEAHNLRLSQKRAEAVRDHLVAQGIAAARLEAKGYGESKPVGENQTKEGRARNRRTELTRLDR